MMISKRPQPVIEKLAGTWCSGGNLGSTISPRSPLEIMSIQSPKSPKKYDFVGGVGLGIVAALERSKHEYVSHHRITRNESRSNQVPVKMEKNEEDYTFMTCHRANKNNSASTKVYYDDGVDHYGGVTRKSNIGSDTKNLKKNGPVIFEISPARYSDDDADFPVTDFLDFCHLCRGTLHGKDIYMYRGEKAFCSKECRYEEIAKDEGKEKKKCRSKLDASRSITANTTNPVSTSPPQPSNRVNFANGITAT